MDLKYTVNKIKESHIKVGDIRRFNDRDYLITGLDDRRMTIQFFDSGITEMWAFDYCNCRNDILIDRVPK